MKSKIFYFFPVLFLSATVTAESLREFHQRKCEEGDQQSCQRAADMLEGERHARRIVELGDQYASQVNKAEFEEDKKPLLSNAYPVVLKHYFTAEAEHGIKQAVADEMLMLCAQHYHNHWRNRKMWWPTDEEGRPDWSTIYYYIVEHYYGYCIRQAF